MDIVRPIVLIAVILLSGCSSIINDFSSDATYGGEIDGRVGRHKVRCTNYHGELYKGTKEDIGVIDACLNHGGGMLGLLCIFVPLPMIDLPFTLVADTVFVPYTLAKNAYERGVYRNADGIVCVNEHDWKKLFLDVKKLNAEKKPIVITDAAIETYDLTGAIFKQAEFEKTEWNRTTGKDMSFANTTFKHSTFKNVSFVNSTFTDVTFEDSEFDDISFEQSRLRGVVFKNCKFKGNTNFANLKQSNVKFYASTLNGASFASAEATLSFRSSALNNVQLTGLIASSALYFRYSNLENVDIDHSKLSRLRVGDCTLYQNGKVAPGDSVMAWYQKAAEQDESGEAYFLLGEMFHEGDDIKTKFLKSDSIDKWDSINKEYAGRGSFLHPTADNNVIWWDFRSKEQIVRGGNIPKDWSQALMWYRKAAERHNSDAQLRIGYMYEKGESVPKDSKMAKAWYDRSASEKDLDDSWE